MDSPFILPQTIIGVCEHIIRDSMCELTGLNPASLEEIHRVVHAKACKVCPNFGHQNPCHANFCFFGLALPDPILEDQGPLKIVKYPNPWTLQQARLHFGEMTWHENPYTGSWTWQNLRGPEVVSNPLKVSVSYPKSDWENEPAWRHLLQYPPWGVPKYPPGTKYHPWRKVHQERSWSWVCDLQQAWLQWATITEF